MNRRLPADQRQSKPGLHPVLPHGLPLLAAYIFLAGLTCCIVPALALEASPNEKERLKSCERKLCTMILLKKKTGDDLNCDLTKTWLQSDIKKRGKRKISWGFGDAQCSTTVAFKRRDIIAALTQRKHTIKLHRHVAHCKIVRNGKLRNVRVVLSPKLKFKHGRARKLWINLKEIEGPSDIKGTVWTAASLADSFGLFHRSMIKGINKFAHIKCRKKFGKELGLIPAKSKNEKK